MGPRFSYTDGQRAIPQRESLARFRVGWRLAGGTVGAIRAYVARQPQAWGMLDQGISAEDLAKRLGMKQVFRIFERTTLLNLRAEYQELLRKKILSNAQAYEISRLPQHLQDRLFALIRDDKCDTYNKLRDAAFALAEAEKQAELFAPPAPPSPQDLKRHATLEEGVERTLALVRKCFAEDGSIPAAATLDPPSCHRLADLLELARRDLGKIESALRKSAIARAH